MRPQRSSGAPRPQGAAVSSKRCPHPGSRIAIEVTSDLGFEYCQECGRKSWWRRSAGHDVGIDEVVSTSTPRSSGRPHRSRRA
jgi:hypothetical protein